MEIFILREGRQTGPFTEDAVRAFLTEGTARPVDLGWRKGIPEWRPLGEVLKSQPAQGNGRGTPPPATSTANETQSGPATGKQKAFLKYLGAEFGENLTKERAALAVSDAMETPKLQARIRKWHDDKLRMHADLFQDELDYRRANRSARYLERIQTEGADVLKDVTKAHVQVLIESLDKRTPGWEAEPDSALWNHLIPAIGEHFPQLVQPAHKSTLKAGSALKAGSHGSRGMSYAEMGPPQGKGTLGAMLRGVLLGVIVLGAIIAGREYLHDRNAKASLAAQTPSAKSEGAPVGDAVADALPGSPIAPAPETALKDPKAVENVASSPEPVSIKPEPDSPANVPIPAVPGETSPTPPPAPVVAEKPAAPAPPAPMEDKPVMQEPNPSPNPPAATPPAPAPASAVPAAPQKMAIKLKQGIGVMLPSGQVTLQAGTLLRNLGVEGENVRVSWNNNVFFVPAIATDVNDPSDSAPAMPPTGPAPGKPAKPADDL